MSDTPRRRVTPFRIAVSSILLLILVVPLALLMGGRMQAEEVLGASMEPTLLRGDRLLVMRREATDPIEKGAIVMVAPRPGDKTPIIKRVLGLPGDKISWIGHAIFINEAPTREGFIERGIADPIQFRELTLSQDQYFIVGDNHAVSLDSTIFGPVSGSEILGKAVYRYAPFSRRGRL